MTIAIAISALLVTLLGVAYVKGYDIVKAHSPNSLPQFYLIMATVRILLILTVFGAFAFLSDNRDDTRFFAIILLLMYVVMLVVTLILRH
ncbi:MAG: hypothetical protein K6A98_02730 [Prevotella sp.]|jgi:cell division protein FtsW (lipid II flippase)|nr:hypothetical protein [Prevotella sp.]